MVKVFWGREMRPGVARICVLLVALALIGSGTSSPDTANAATAAQNGAVSWARSYADRHDTSYNGLCLSFVFNAYSAAGINLRSWVTVPIGSNTYPADIWGHFNHGTTGGGTPPFGALVFWRPQNGDRTNSHVALSIGDGNLISTSDGVANYTHYESMAAHSYAVYQGWWLPEGTTGDGGGGIGEGSLVSHNGFVYRIAGGAPIYVSNWGAIGGPQPVTPLNDAQFAALPQFPRDGTLLDGSAGRVYVVAGGAPLYLSTYDAIGGPRSGIRVDEAAIDNAGAGVPWDHLRPYPADGTLLDASDTRVYIVAGGAPLYLSNYGVIGGPRPGVRVDGWDVANTSDPHAHLRPYPADGTLLEASNGRVYVAAGGAPLYLSTYDAIGGPRPGVRVDAWDVDNTSDPHAHLRPYPADGTLLDASDTRVYIVAGGAPLYLSNYGVIGGPRPGVRVDGWDVANTSDPNAHLRPYPVDGTFLNTSLGQVYRIAGGAPIAVSSWGLFGGVQPYVTVDQWAVDHRSETPAHLRAAPLDGTIVMGLPSNQLWQFDAGLRSPGGAAERAVAVDDAGLGNFAIRSTAAASASVPSIEARGQAKRRRHRARHHKKHHRRHHGRGTARNHQ
jgi:hypothetical protein